ncbi:MAG: ATP-dependent DNA helicase RecQ [Flavobacteriales bacterium]|nr:ATP-dependent DNA helicase RecQ [Flavobacteriales bacterium]MBT4102309.1 ATP-dependent DNA helicase RecQ [Flavobacteriales bacterium]MBT6624028.1 ATP-dependent DNA helicase RecQ [Flavobacteriales bacterium]MBT6817202.1 ATP-dependent DNA helicase RecQ [Flavobacteriales bacterium]
MSSHSIQQTKNLLKQFFGFTDFKGQQEPAIESILSGKDVFVMMPTGGGKSLCFQLPALQMEGVTVVVSPLIALMKNQVDVIRNFGKVDGIAHVWNSSLNKRQMVEVRQDLSSGVTKLLYMAPESLAKQDNIDFLKLLNVSFFAIDEAHCISEWGHDFRPDYRNIVKSIEAIGRKPIIALTATATPKVKLDILKTLDISDAETYTSSFNRSNLYYGIQPKDQVEKNIVRLLLGHKGKSAIVYCMSRKKVEAVAQVLQLNGLSALPYHAGLDRKTRVKHQDAFLNEDCDIIVATIAFGMGIDKPDVRLVVHHDIPKSLESYYQETGRAGRDGGEGICITFYAKEDIEKMDKFLSRKPVAEQEVGRQLLLESRGYASTSACRRKFLLHYFGESYHEDNCGQCDNCERNDPLQDVTKEAKLICEIIQEGRDNFRTIQVVNVLLGNETSILNTMDAQDLDQWGKGTEHSLAQWENLIGQLSLSGAIVKDIERYGVLYLAEEGLSIMKGKATFKSKPHQEIGGNSRSSSDASKESVLDPVLYDLLKAENKSIAKQKGIPPYALFSDATLQDMATSYPTTEDELKTMAGVGESKARRYGTSLINCIKNHVEANGIERMSDFAIISSGQRSATKVYIIQGTDRRQDLESMSKNKGISIEQLMHDMELIVQGGTKINIQYILKEMLDEDSIEELMEYFSDDSESGDIIEAYHEFDGTYTEEELRMVRIHFLTTVL